MNTVSTFEAKNKLSELLAAASEGEPQIITKNGVETAVLISYKDFRKLTARQESLTEFLLHSPLRHGDIDLTRSTDTGRATLRFDEESA
jgi:prevent-host-death family protein